jgi:hypothetical protein
MTGPYDVPLDSLVRAARVERAEQVEAEPPVSAVAPWDLGLPYGDGAGGDVDGDGD